VLRRMLGPKREEVIGDWRRLLNEELHKFYSSPNIISVLKSRRHLARMVHIRNVHKILVGKSEGRRPLGKPRCRWEDNIRMALRETGWEVLDWVHLAQDRDQWLDIVNTVMNDRIA
jgi:hypothetical protein